MKIEYRRFDMDLKVNAEVYRLGLLIGYHSVQDVVKWADKQIEILEKPPIEIIEVSLSSKAKPVDVCSKLKLVKGDIEDELTIKIMLGLLNDSLYKKDKSTSDISNMLYLLSQHIPNNSEWIIAEIMYISDEFYLAEETIYGDLFEVIEKLKKFLIQFDKYVNYI
jgi:hypothetical protein